MIEVVENKVSAEGMGFMKVISDRAVTEAWMMSLVPGAAREFASVTCYPTAALSLFYGEVTYPMREVVEFKCEGWKRPRRLVVWRLMESEGYRMSEIIEFLAEWYFMKTHRQAQYVFVKSLPKGVERFTDVAGLCLLDVDWCLEKTLMVGG
jgi:hypothetical protein